MLYLDAPQTSLKQPHPLHLALRARPPALGIVARVRQTPVS